ncbi:T7SS effector LXG polymorphic toxin [Virgibacillus sp. FSP13]
MGNKVDISEVNELSDDLKSTSEKIKSDLDHIKADIDQIIAMETFSGKTAKQAKGYFGDLHKTILDAFNGLFTDLNDNLKQHLDLFESDVDSSKTAIIESDYLTDTEMDVDEDYEQLDSEHQSVNETINSVADISSATAPSFSTVTSDENEVIETITDLNEKLSLFTSEGKQHDSQIKSLLQQIEVAMEGAVTKRGEARFTDYKGGMILGGLPALKGYVQTYRRKEAFAELGLPYMNNVISPSGAAGSGLNFYGNYFDTQMNGLQPMNNIEGNKDEAISIQTILHEQKSIEWNGEKGGYETQEIWKINSEINEYKSIQKFADSRGDIEAKEEAEQQENRLREEYADLSEYLIGKDAPPHDVPNEPLKLKNGETFNYRVDSEGYLHYEVESGYEYYEETHKQTTGEKVQGVIAKTAFTTLVGWGTTSLTASASIRAQLTLSGAGAAGGASSELLGASKYNVLYVPSTDEVKTMIYRTNKDTGKTDHFVIDSKGQKILKNTGWKEYK